MQIKNNRANYLQNPWFIGVVKGLLLGGSLYFIYSKLRDQSISVHELSVPQDFGITLSLVAALMVINWYLDALRWRVSVGVFEKITINEAWQVVLGGLALNWVMPFTSGDLLVRIARRQDKYQATAAAILNRGIMLAFTLALGLYGLKHLSTKYEQPGLASMAIIFGLPFIAYLFRHSLHKFWKYFGKLNRKVLMRIIGLSLLRYGVFVFQFYLLLALFLPALSAEVLIAGIGWVFLVRSVFPLFLGGMGVREASGLMFFEGYVQDLHLVLIPIFLIWLVNTVLPSIAGLFFVWRMKLSGD